MPGAPPRIRERAALGESEKWWLRRATCETTTKSRSPSTTIGPPRSRQLGVEPRRGDSHDHWPAAPNRHRRAASAPARPRSHPAAIPRLDRSLSDRLGTGASTPAVETGSSLVGYPRGLRPDRVPEVGGLRAHLGDVQGA